jgi:ketosteroid isomerase-like protein
MKLRLLLTLIGLAVSPVVSAIAQEQTTVDPEVRQQIEAALTKFDEAFNKNDATATAALYTQDAAEVVSEWSAGGLAFGQQAIEKRHAANFASSPGKLSHKLLQVHAIGNEICAISEWSMPPIKTKGGHYVVTIYVREADDWKIRMAYVN